MRLATKQHRRRISSRAGLPGALIIMCNLSAPLSAQSTAATALSVGQRVRIVPWEGAPPVVGTLIARRSDSLIVGRGKDTVGVERNNLTQIEQSLGPRRDAMGGMVTGLLLGGSLGAILGAATYKPCRQTGFLACAWTSRSRSEAAQMGGIFGALPGLLVGAIVGIPTEKWVPASVESVTQFRVAPRGKGVVAQLSFSFH